MGKIYLDTNAIWNIKSNIDSKAQACRDYSYRIGTIRTNIDCKVLNRRNINTRLNNLKRRVLQQSDLLCSYSRALSNVNSNITSTDARLKDDTKRIICRLNRMSYINQYLPSASQRSKRIWEKDLRKYTFASALFGGKILGPLLTTKAYELNLKDFAVDIIKELGYAGSAGGFVSGIINGIVIGGMEGSLHIAKSGTSIIKDLIDLDKDIINMGKVKHLMPKKTYETSWGKKITGIGKDIFDGKASVAKNFSTRMYNNFSKTISKSFESFDFKKGAGKATLSWAGVALSGAINAFDNKKEYESGEITSTRAVKETVMETAIDVGKGIVIGAAVTAGIAATVGSAPVLAVAAGTALVTAGLDCASKALCGKDLTEALSDVVLDSAEMIEKVANQIQSIGKTAGSFLKSAFQKKVNCFKNASKTTYASWKKCLA